MTENNSSTKTPLVAYITVVFLFIGLGIIKVAGISRAESQQVVDIVLDAYWPKQS